MYAVIRTGGKQYRVAPGDVVKDRERNFRRTRPSNSATCWLSAANPGTMAKPATAKVTAEVLGEGRGDKIPGLPPEAEEAVQEAAGARQNFTEVRIKGHPKPTA